MSEGNFEQPQKPAVGIAKESKAGQKTSGVGLYDIKETEAGFEVTLPGLFDKKREAIVGTSKRRFETSKEAEKAVEDARERVRIQFERSLFEKIYSGHFFRIDE